MGTRGSVGFIANEKNYITYNHYDSYPSGLGSEVINFMINTNNWDYIKEKVIKLIKVNELDDCPDELKDKYSQFHQDVSRKTDWYAYLRDLQGVEWLYHLDEIEHMSFMDGDLNEIIKDSWLEYSYIIDLDTMEFKFWYSVNDEADVIIPLQLINKVKVEDLEDPEKSEFLKNIKVEERKIKLDNINM